MNATHSVVAQIVNLPQLGMPALKALWQQLFTSEAPTLAEGAKLVGVDSAYVSCMVNLTTLAPDIVEAILDEILLNTVTLFDLASNTPLLWEERALLKSA